MRNIIRILNIGLIFTIIIKTAQAAAPQIDITGPIASDFSGTRGSNAIYSASAIELIDNGYIEEEFFIEGLANTYSTGDLQSGEIVSTGHDYRTRLVVRRPKQLSAFNGTAIVEWMNVTGGTDKDIDWWFSGDHFISKGYAYVFVSTQQDGIKSLKNYSADRYGSLNVSHNRASDKDALSYDIFTAVGYALSGQSGVSLQSRLLGSLKPETLIATGHSQSASRLAVYLNSIHFRNPIYDGFMIHGGGGRIRDDKPVRIFKVMSETDLPIFGVNRQPNTDRFRQWEVAGSSHVDLDFELEYAKVRLQQGGQSPELAEPRMPDCALPSFSRIPFRHVMNSAYEHLVVWVQDGLAPPEADFLKITQAIPEFEFARDAFGNILGGIRLAMHEVPTAKNTGMNNGNSPFCYLYGSHEPFSKEILKNLYSTSESYMRAVREIVEKNIDEGFILSADGRKTVDEAKRVVF